MGANSVRSQRPRSKLDQVRAGDVAEGVRADEHLGITTPKGSTPHEAGNRVVLALPGRRDDVQTEGGSEGRETDSADRAEAPPGGR